MDAVLPTTEPTIAIGVPLSQKKIKKKEKSWRWRMGRRGWNRKRKQATPTTKLHDDNDDTFSFFN